MPERVIANLVVLVVLFGLSAKAQTESPATLLLACLSTADTSKLVWHAQSPDREKVLFILVASQTEAPPPPAPGDKSGLIMAADLSQASKQQVYDVQLIAGVRYEGKWWGHVASHSFVSAFDQEEALTRAEQVLLPVPGDQNIWESGLFPQVIQDE